jgi:alpha-tubulin suppressor-like RCC1 family protein
VLSGTFAAGTNHALSIHADGTLWATGGNNGGQLGDGTTTRRAAWGQVGTATNWVQVAAGNFFSLGLRTDGTLWA